MKTNFRPGIVICSRLDSERVPGKVLKTINGVPIIRHLVERLSSLKVPVIVAVPTTQCGAYEKAVGAIPGVQVWPSKFATDPLARTYEVAKAYGLTHVVRVTHDKIFVDLELLDRALKIALYENEGVEYIHSSTVTPGTGFEIITADCLLRATANHKNVEHITYAVRPISKMTLDLLVQTDPFNLLIDFPEDIKAHEVIFSALGNKATLPEVRTYLKRNPEIARINLPPLLTIYTCAYNAEKFILRAMNSVAHQGNFKKDFEYIIVDDFSTDKTIELVAKFALGKPNVSWFRNQSNKGLASSSNVALSKARGRYILRLDADDFFVDDTALANLIDFAQSSTAEIIYPDNYFGDLGRIQKGSEKHHAGGALFDKKALNFLRFKDGLRNHDSLDIFTRAQSKLKIGYYEKPLFFYTQRPDSMSKTNLKEREQTASGILSGASL